MGCSLQPTPSHLFLSVSILGNCAPNRNKELIPAGIVDGHAGLPINREWVFLQFSWCLVVSKNERVEIWRVNPVW